MLTCLSHCWSNISVDDKRDVSTFFISLHVREVCKVSVFQVGRIHMHNQACSQLLHSGGGHSNKVCQFEYWYNFTVSSGIFDICNQLSKWYALINGSTVFFLIRHPLVFLALLYRETRHWTWYLASSAKRSPVLNLASRLWCCNCRGHSVTRHQDQMLKHGAMTLQLLQVPTEKHCFVSATLWTEL